MHGQIQPENLELVSEGVMEVVEACGFTRMSRSALYNAMSRGQIPFLKVGRRRLVPRRALLEFLAERVRGGVRET